MPSTSNRVRKAIRFLVRLSEAFDRAFLAAEFAVDGNKDFIRWLYRSYLFPGATVVEVGGGKNPFQISAGEKRELRSSSHRIGHQRPRIKRRPGRCL